MRLISSFAALMIITACGGSEYSAPTASHDDAPSIVAPHALDASPDASCWRCADRAWRNVCVVPAVRAPDAESCLFCGEHCVSDPPDAAAD